MGTITSIFQGAIQVPLFKTPYTVSKPANYPQGLSTGAQMTGTSAFPCLFNQGFDYAQVSNSPLSVLNGGIMGLSYQGAATLLINGGWTAGGLNQAVPFNWNGSVMTFGFTWAEYLPGSSTHFDSWFGITMTPLAFQDRVAGQQIPSSSIDDVNAYPWTLNNTSAYQGLAGNLMVGAYTNPLTNLAAPCYVAITYEQFDHTEIVGVIPNVSMFNSALASPTGGFRSLSQYAETVNFPLYGKQPGIGTQYTDTSTNVLNYLFGFSVFGDGITYLIWDAPFGGLLPSLNVLDSGKLVFDNNSNLNAQITKYHSATVMTVIGTRGMLATDIDGQIDYFVSPDGSKYWRLYYVSQGGAPAPANPNSTEANYKFVDANGIFWYTGSSVQNVGTSTIQPLYSLGFNIPYSTYTLPGVPPFRLPCYDDCLGAGWPLTKI